MKTKRIISLLLVISIIFSMTPSLSVNAAGQEPENTAATAEGAANTTPEGETNPPDETGSNSDGPEIFAPRNMMLFSNSGANEVEYRRKSPEVAILNRYTGNSLKFYDTLTNPSSSYNGIGLFGKTVDSKLYAEGFSEDYSEEFGEDFLIYDDFKNEDNILNQLNSIKDEFGRDIDNLEAGVSGTFHNNWHTHTVSGGDAEDGFRDEEEFEVMSYSIIKLRKENTTIIKQSGKKKDYQTKPRIGNGEFASLRYHKDYPLMLQLSRSVTYYSPYREFCTCGGHHVEKVVVAFRDQRAPQISEVYMEEEKEGENEYVNIYKNTQYADQMEDLVFGEGKEINIKIKYDEPIRFADDSAAGKENLYVRLVVDGAVEGSGESIHPKAYLTKLDEDTLYFSHTVPADPKVNYTISQIDLSPLIGTGIPLKQVGPVAQYEKKKILGVEIDVIKGWEDGSFEVEVPSDVQGKALGFTESSSYITDLAGNAINNELIIPTLPFYIDTQGVEVTEIVPNFSSRHYYEIKDMLGKTNPYDVDYPDESDTHIGTNSIFNFNITFNKTLAIGDLGKSKYSEPYTNLIATTNMIDKDNKPISLQSKRADQRGPIKNLVTTISFENSPPLDSGVTCDDENGILRVTGISYDDNTSPLKDKSGNELSLNNINLNSMTKTLYLDNKYAEVNTTLSQDGGIYTTEPITIGGKKRAFRFPFVVKDNGSTASGVNGLTGKFRWVKKTETSAVIAENWPFEYIITAETDLSKINEEDWSEGYMGCKEYKFTQIEGANHYLYIRPVAEEEYSLFDTDLQFQALDYAGNKREWNDWISFPIDVVWEDQPPTASPGEVRRKLDESGYKGTIEVDVMLQDRSALKEAFYLWNNSQELPENPLWKDATNFTSGNKEGKITATETVTAAVYGSGSTEAESFSQNLWIKVSDEFNNELTANMGLYEYNLTQVGYELGCTSAITDKASIEVKKIDSGGSLVLMVKDPNTTEEYFVRVFDDTVAGQEAFSHGNSWLRMKVIENNWGYEFEHLSGRDKDYIDRISGGPSNSDSPYFSGNLQVTVLSGRNEAFSFGTISGYPLQAGNVSHPVAKETVSLRVSHNNEDKTTDTFPNISFSPIQTINTKPASGSDDYFWSEEEPFLSTAEGVEFTVDLGEDKYGWNYEDIDFANSYIELKYLDAAPYNTRFQAYLSSGRYQRVVFPKGDYKKGDYAVTLHLKCYVGKDYEIMLSDSEGAYQTMYIDPTPASTDFGVSSLTYTPSGSQFKDELYSHGLDKEEYFNWEIDAYSNDQVIYLPAHMPEWPNILTVKINDYTDLGQHGVKIWNITTGGKAEDAEFSSIESYDSEGTRSFYLTTWDTVVEAQNERGVSTEGSKKKTKLGLVNNQDNLIAVQVCNRNGLNSQIKYYTIHPVDEEVKGSTSVSLGEDGSNVVGQGNAIFTPESGQLMDGVRVFATAIASGESTNSDGPREMAAQYDGTYTCPLTEGRNWYYIYSIDKYGNLNLYDITISGQQSTFDPPIGILDKEPPVVTKLNSPKGEGMYEAVFKIKDATINAYKFKQVGGREYVYIPLDISLYFDSAYTEVLGVQEGMSLDLRINENEDEYIWTTKGVNPMGIYEVKAERKGEAYEQYLQVTVKGAVPHKENVSSYSPTLYMDVRDNFGNSTVADNSLRGSAKFTDVVSVQPRAYTFTENPAKSPEYNYVTGKYHGSGTANMGLVIEFNMPVLPESSWINPEPEYGAVQERAFPITKDGMQEIKYYDVFGNPFTQELDIGVLVDAGAEISVDIDPADLTAGDVIVSLKRDKYNPGGGILLFKKEGEELTLVSDDELTKSDVIDEKKITLGENATLIVYKLPKGYNYETYEEMISNEFELINCHKTEIHISNIVKGAPEAKGYLYFTETGREYAIGDELPNQTSGNIQVRYTTSRKTSPIEGTDSIHTFKYGGNSSYTFYFEDQLGLTGNLKVDLNALGVTIVKPSQLIVDEEDPLITVNMYAKQFDRYSLATVFSSGATGESIKAAFDAMAYVQGYLFEVNVLNQSDYKIVLMKEVPTGISYQVATSQTIEGVSLSGRTITVTENLKDDIYVVVVDNAKAETGAEKDNYSYILLKASDMTPYFDTIAPIAITETVSNSLYEKTVYISFSDKANADSEKETGLITLTSHKLEKETGQIGETAKYNGWYKLTFNDSSTEYLVFYDMAGNRGTAEISVGEIGTSKPELTVTWSPAYVSNDGDIDTSSPTLGPVNTDVKAIITADKPMKEVVPLGYTYGGEDWKNWPETLLGQSLPSNIDYTSNSERITVTFKGKIDESEQVIGVRVKVKAPNGKESEIVLLLSEIAIDKKPPTIEGVVNYKNREGFSTPYAAEIILTPDEPSYCLNAGKADTLYNSDNPLKINTNKNETKTYRFRDKAGNIGDVEVITKDIDITPPIITTDPKDTKNFASSTEVNVTIKVNEDCKIEQGENQSFDLAKNEEKELTFTKNGVYSIKASDLAGNTAVATVVIGNIDKTAPMISFDNMTIRVRQGSGLPELKEMLGEGVKVWDNLDKPEDLEVKYNIEGTNEIPKLDLTVPDLYTIPYTVTDTAGNEGYANRYIRVFDKDMPGVIIDDIITEPDGTIVLFQGEHKLTIEGLKTIVPGEMEPYTIKICNGIRSEGQMKYYSSTVPVDSEGNFTLRGKGFYTLYITTQSRQSYRTLLYVEK